MFRTGPQAPIFRRNWCVDRTQVRIRQNRRKNVVWSDEQEAVLREMWLTNTAPVIAKALGPNFTKNAVIGKAFRLGLPRKIKYSEVRRSQPANGATRGVNAPQPTASGSDQFSEAST